MGTQPARAALQPLMSSVAERLGADGWVRHSAPPAAGKQSWDRFTSARPNGLLATLTVIATRTTDSSLTVELHGGVGHEGATALGSALTLPVYSRQLAPQPPGRLLEHHLAAFGPADLAEFVDGVAADAARSRREFADAFRDVNDLLRHLMPAAQATAAHRRRALRDSFLLAASTGSTASARSFLDDLEQHPEPAGTPHGRFLRQARRWLDSGSPTASVLPDLDSPVPQLQLPLLHAVRTGLERSVARRDAELRLSRRMRRQPQLTTRELRSSLITDLQEHGHPTDPADAACTVDALARQRRFLGRTRTRVEHVQMVVDLGARLTSAARAGRLTQAVAAPAAHATFPVVAARDSWAEVLLDTPGIETARRVTLANAFRIGPVGILPCWLDLSTTRDAHVVVNVGDATVGRLNQEDSAAYSRTMAEATALGELPRVDGYFVDLDDPVLTIPLPAGHATVTP